MMVTTLYAAILGLIYIGLTLFVIKGRFKYMVSLGDGGNDALTKRIRVHANFAEFVPFALLLIILVEFEGTSELIIHVLGSLLVVGRLLHVYGVLTKEGSSLGRAGGMIITLLVMLISAIICIKSFFLL